MANLNLYICSKFPVTASFPSIDMHLFVADENYSYLINGDALSDVEDFIDDEDNTYEEYIDVCIVYTASDI